MILNVNAFGTPNTNLASCIGALGISIFKDQPADKERDLDTGRETIRWFFEFKHPTDRRISSRMCEKWWRDREQFEAANPEHPMVFMRRALEKYQWLTLLWHRKVFLATGVGEGKFRTGDIVLAACLMANGSRLTKFEVVSEKAAIYHFAFEPEEEFLVDFGKFLHAKSPAAWMRHAIEAKILLLTLLKDPRCRWRETAARGNPQHGGWRMSVYEGTNPLARAALEAKFDELT